MIMVHSTVATRRIDAETTAAEVLETPRPPARQLRASEGGLPEMVEHSTPVLIPPVCPRPDCELPIVSDVTRTVRGVVLSDRMCQAAHPTMVKWVAR